ncbi:MAG: FAD-dependent thymidylate synthase, partial [Candidatus Andersenbacteria bacterium]
MKRTPALKDFAPPFAADTYSPANKRLIGPFFTNLNQSVYVPLITSPEVIGALCSRTSRAAGDLRAIFLQEYIRPFLSPKREAGERAAAWRDKVRYGQGLKQFIAFLQRHPITEIFSNPRARSFYTKWLAQYGDDSIAQMAGTHLVYSSLSQVAIKHFEDQRIGLAPIEKSTRYVDYSTKIKGQYLYYTDPTLQSLGLTKEYRRAMDGLFKTYVSLMPRLQRWLQGQFPEEKPSVIEKKAFDTLRGLLPTSTLSQVAFFGNGQAFEYLVSRSLKHPLGEIRWAGERAYSELSKVTPSFLRRVKDTDNQKVATAYQEYLSGKGARLQPLVKKHLKGKPQKVSGPTVELIEFDPDGENKIIAGMLYAIPTNHHTWSHILRTVKKLSEAQKRKIIEMYFAGRTQRWQKVGRALENTYVRFELTMNIGAWRDL